MKEKIEPYRSRFLLLGLAGLGYLWFFLLERAVKTPTYILYTALDDHIPFIPAFVVFYAAWYLYLLIPAVFLFFTDEKAFLRYGAFLTAALWTACFVYTFWQNGIELRPDMTGAPGVFNAAIRFLYSIDTPTNSAPSLHVAQSVAAHIAITRHCRKNSARRWVTPASFVLCVLIILSTVLIKQHSVVDLLWGLVLGAVLSAAIYGKLIFRKRRGGTADPS